MFYSDLILADWGSTEDRAMFQFKVRVWDNEWADSFVNKVFDNLQLGYSLADAVEANEEDILRAYDDPNAIDQYDLMNEFPPDGIPTLPRIARIEGDSNMTLRGLYSATSQERAQGVWYKVKRL